MRLVFFDLETGGRDWSKHPITQIAAIAVDEQLRELDAREWKVRFKSSFAEPEALKLNGYDEAVWQREALSPSLVCTQVAEFLKQFADVEMISQRTNKPYNVAQLVGHNAATFDAPFLQEFFRLHSQFLPASYRVMDTLQRAIWHFHERTDGAIPTNFKLETLCKFFQVPLDNAHDALADVRATVGLYRALMNVERSQAA